MSVWSIVTFVAFRRAFSIKVHIDSGLVLVLIVVVITTIVTCDLLLYLIPHYMHRFVHSCLANCNCNGIVIFMCEPLIASIQQSVYEAF